MDSSLVIIIVLCLFKSVCCHIIYSRDKHLFPMECILLVSPMGGREEPGCDRLEPKLWHEHDE